MTQVLIGIGQIARDTLIWLHAINADCTGGAAEEQVGIIFDNVNSLIGLVDSRTTAIDNEEQLLYALVDSRNTLILDKIAAIQASLNLELKITIENDLLQGTAERWPTSRFRPATAGISTRHLSGSSNS